jgi:hypothetical protein
VLASYYESKTTFNSERLNTGEQKMNPSKVLMTAAIAGMLSVGAVSVAHAASEKGECMGANACKGKSGCKTAANECKGQNGCKGKGFTETTKAKCDKMAKKNSAITFQSKM